MVLIKKTKYSFRQMKIGQKRYVLGVEPKHAQMAWYRYKTAHPELAHRQYLWWRVNGGICIERVG